MGVQMVTFIIIASSETDLVKYLCMMHYHSFLAYSFDCMETRKTNSQQAQAELVYCMF